jgi:hypothetical protein
MDTGTRLAASVAYGGRVGVSVRRSRSRRDEWAVIPGETRWIDYSCEQTGEELVVYLHAFRRVRERSGASHDLLLWKPATTKVAQRYAAGEWEEVVRAEREWPPTEVELVARRTGRRPRLSS